MHSRIGGIEIPFTLHLTNVAQSDQNVSKYHTNLMVLHAYYGEKELAGIHSSSSFLEPPSVELPVHISRIGPPVHTMDW